MQDVHDYLIQKETFSGVVSISQHNKIIFEQVYGLKDRGNQIKNELRTKFFVGSMISKPITALSIMQLVEQGKISVTQPIEDFFPHYKNTGITIQHLLNHTSGIVNYLMLRKKIKWEQDYTPQQILEVVQLEELKYSPGKKASYSNTGYLMLGLLIESITGLPYEQYVRENIFQPAGMKNTGFIRDGIESHALNYVNHKLGPKVSPSVLFACGEVVSTIEDIHKFDQALKSGLLVLPETIRFMETPSYKGKYVTLGSGWFIKNLMGRKSISHGGNHPGGYTSHFERYIDEDLTIIVLSNDIVSHSRLMIKDFGGTFISREIASIIFNDKLHFWQKII
ncbi:serine hydrolase domain-containing protein [Fredinandcohnia humi]